MSTHVHLTLVSSNGKVGPIPVSTTEAKTCPPSCPFNHQNEGGCYAEQGPLKLHWQKVSDHLRGMAWRAFCHQIAALPSGQIWRHNQAGDLCGVGETINAGEFRQLIAANNGKRGFTYTHKYNRDENLALIAEANANGFTVNLSANSLRHADKLADTKAGPVVCVLPSDQNTNTVTPAGRRVVVCPATQRDDITCAKCGLCSVATRSVIVGFPAHGTAKRKASSVASN